MNCRAFGWILCTATRFAVFYVELISFSFNYLFCYILIKSTTSNSLKSRSRDFQKTESLQMKTRKMNQIFSTVKSVTVTVFSSSSTLKNRQKKFSPSSSKKQINFLFFFVSLLFALSRIPDMMHVHLRFNIIPDRNKGRTGFRVCQLHTQTVIYNGKMIWKTMVVTATALAPYFVCMKKNRWLLVFLFSYSTRHIFPSSFWFPYRGR